jgi:hypothetical protein
VEAKNAGDRVTPSQCRFLATALQYHDLSQFKVIEARPAVDPASSQADRAALTGYRQSPQGAGISRRDSAGSPNRRASKCEGGGCVDGAYLAIMLRRRRGEIGRWR